MADSRRKPAEGVMFPVLLISAGVLFLLVNIGAVDSSIWWRLLPLWPVLLILAGVDLILTRWGRPGQAASFLVGLAIVAGAAWWALPAIEEREPAEIVAIEHSLEGASHGVIRLEPGIMSVRTAGPARSGILLEGRIALDGAEPPEQRFSMANDTATLELAFGSFRWIFPTVPSPATRWELQLSDEVPLELEIKSGVGNLELDLTPFQIERLLLDSGVGGREVRLPSRAMEARFESLVGDLTIVVPQDAESRIAIEGGLHIRSIDERFAERDDGTHATGGYETAAERIDIVVDGGVGTLMIR